MLLLLLQNPALRTDALVLYTHDDEGGMMVTTRLAEEIVPRRPPMVTEDKGGWDGWGSRSHQRMARRMRVLEGGGP